ncbi:MAG TPA: hypothetical protein PLC79_07035, partial [Phycisphaerae bacterium]|nr:hypothetical protein [Phycisphaerae bacterium]
VKPCADPLDVLLYRELRLPELTRDEARKRIRAWFDRAEGPEKDEPDLERQEEIEMNVREWMREQARSRRMVQRVRTDGQRWRMDQCILAPEQALSPEIRLSDTFVMLGQAATRDAYRVFEYTAAGRAARIVPEQTVYGGTPVTDWLSVPFIWSVRLQFGRLGDGGRILLDETKRDECIRRGGVTHRGRTIRVRHEPAPATSGGPRDRVDFFAGEGGTRLVMSVVCDHDDYARVFRFEAYNEDGTLGVLKEADEYDAEGLPHSVRMVTYAAGGAVADDTNITFLAVDTKPVFADDVFEFRPPPGYAIVDVRQSPGQVIREAQPGAPEAGETVGGILSVLRTGPLTPGRRSWELKIELPASRPTTQPAGAGGSATRPAAGGR